MSPASGPPATSPAPPRPSLLVFDVNETLSDMSPLGSAFATVGLAAQDATVWFTSVLRDAFALTVMGDNPPFATVATETLSVLVSGTPGVDATTAVETVMSAVAALEVHPDVPDGLQRLHAAGLRMVTLSNGAASVAESLLDRAGASGSFERFLSVEDAPAWKPASSAYTYALRACDISASDAMLVAVHPWDIAGARRAGLRTAWVNRAGVHYPGHFPTPDLEVQSLSDLADAMSATT